MATLIGVGLPLALAAAASSISALAALFALAGLFLGPCTGALFTARQNHAPAPLPAQVFPLGAGIKTTAAATGAALAGTIAHAATTTQLLLVGASPILAGLLGALLLGPGAIACATGPGAAGSRAGACRPRPRR